MIKFDESPFFLNKEDIKWVKDTLSGMTDDEKIGQLFCPIGYSTDKGYLKNEFINRNVGGLMFRDDSSEKIHETYNYLQCESDIPMLLAANLEAGGNGLLTDGTYFGKPLQIAATNDRKMAYELGRISCIEAGSVGCNFAFAPVVDIDINFRNPITNVRTYGSDIERIIDFSSEYIRAATENNFVTSIKHFPGDGVDERDQHILTSVNDMSITEWDETFGRIYKHLINFGTKAVMVGHIALPAYEEFLSGKESTKITPASLSKELNIKLLRGILGFNGLIITDATPMVGFCASEERSKAVPLSIENGCDMFLFNKDLSEDFAFMKHGLEDGILSYSRLDEAVTRILATKASIKLHTKEKKDLVPEKKPINVVGCKEHRMMAKLCAKNSITLVKDTSSILPIDSSERKNVLLQILGDCESDERVYKKFEKELLEEGFNVIPYQKEGFDENGAMRVDSVKDFKEKYDLVIYIGNVENASNKTTNRLNWYTFFGLGNNIPWFVEEVPTIFISVANPYHLYDVPMIKTYINCYSNSDFVIESCIKKLVGKEPFTGINPVDPFCGRKELRY